MSSFWSRTCFLFVVSFQVFGTDAGTSFLQMEHAIAKKRISQPQQLQSVSHHVLYPYLLEQLLRQRVATLTAADLKRFIHDYADLPTTPSLIDEWMAQKSQQKAFGEILKLEQVNPTYAQRCHRVLARYHHQGNDILELKRGIPLVEEETLAPQPCQQLFATLYAHGFLTESLIEHRIKRLKKNAYTHVRAELNRYLSGPMGKLLTALEASDAASIKTIQLLPTTPVHPFRAFVVGHTFRHFAKKDLKKAIEQWFVFSKSHALSKTELAYAQKEIAIQLSRQQKAEALDWLNSIPRSLEDEETGEWRVRASLRQNNWVMVKDAVLKGPAGFSSQPKWQFWLARAYVELAHEPEARALLHTVARDRSFYGFLASTYLKQPLSITTPARRMDAFVLDRAKKANWFKRMRAWKQLGNTKRAQKEWSYAMTYLSEDDKHAFAKIFNDQGDYYQAIMTLSKNPKQSELSLRFPVIYRDTVEHHARRLAVDPAWVYAITRQESAFRIDAKSSQGAMGLMQIMPGTAQFIAKKMGVRYSNKQELLRADMNLMLGIGYLDYLKRTFNQHPALATAAYNAGPGRVLKWLPEETMPLDQWVEMIPYQETREYVMNVMTYYGIYKHLLSQTPKFQDWLRPVVAKKK